jgi:hypothetical protein
MNKRIRTALAALLIAFAIAFSALQLGGFSQMAGSGGVRPVAGSAVKLGPSMGVIFVLLTTDNEDVLGRRKP